MADDVVVVSVDVSQLTRITVATPVLSESEVLEASDAFAVFVPKN